MNCRLWTRKIGAIYVNTDLPKKTKEVGQKKRYFKLLKKREMRKRESRRNCVKKFNENQQGHSSICAISNKG